VVIHDQGKGAKQRALFPVALVIGHWGTVMTSILEVNPADAPKIATRGPAEN